MNSSLRSGSRAAEPTGRQFVLWLAAILAVAGAAYLDLAWEDPIFQRAEDYFAEAAREMSALSQHITPILYGKPFFDKPIWSYWGIQASFALFGPTHFAARAPSILAGLATIALIASAAARVWGKREGLMAGAVLATAYAFFYYSTLAMSDIWLVLFCTAAAILLFAGSGDPHKRTRDWNGAAFFLGMTLLTKGPVGVVLPAAALLLYLLIRRELGQIRPRVVLTGLAIIAAVAVPWYAALWMQQGTAAMRAFFVVENMQRFTGAAYATHHPFGFIPVSLLVDFLPWSIFLPAALWQSVRAWRTDWDSRESRGALFLWCYVAVVVGFFWVARTQMDYYVLPALPACAVLTGIYLNRGAREASLFFRATAWISALGYCAAGAALFLVAMAAKGGHLAPLRAMPPGLQAFWPLAVLMFAGGAAGAILTYQRRYTALLALTVLGFCGGAILGVHAAIPLYLRAFPLPTLASESLHDGEPAALSPDLEHWRGELSFETHRIPLLTRTPQQMADFLAGPGPHLAIVTDAWRAKLPLQAAEQEQVIYSMPLLRQGITLKDILDPKVVAQTTDGIAVLYFPGAVSTSDSGRATELSKRELSGAVTVSSTGAQTDRARRAGL